MTIRVLIADDQAIVLDGLRAILGAAPGINVIAQARNGHEVVRRTIDLRPDVVVMEVALPGLSGIEATHEIRKQCATCKVVILSTHSAGTVVYRALRAGVDGYLVKNAESAEVALAIRSVHIGERYLSKKITESIIDDIVAGAELLSPLERLSMRERQIIELVVESKSSAQIAEALGLSAKTVDTYRSRLMRKLKVADVQQLVKFAIRHGLTTSG